MKFDRVENSIGRGIGLLEAQAGVVSGARSVSLGATERLQRIFAEVHAPEKYLPKGRNKLRTGWRRVSTRVVWSRIKDVYRKLNRCVCNLHDARAACPFIKIDTERLSKIQLQVSAK